MVSNKQNVHTAQCLALVNTRHKTAVVGVTVHSVLDLNLFNHLETSEDLCTSYFIT